MAGLPFSGLKVLDVTRVLAGPFASYQMALLGADVVKIEDPRSGGDAMRHYPCGDMDLTAQGRSSGFLSQNANKKSLTLDLRTPEGQAIFRDLARDADVVIENLRGGTMDGYGLGYAALSEINPRLVYCSVTGYGSSGPKMCHPAYDLVIQAASGLMSMTGTAESGPLRVGSPIIDFATGLSAAFGLSAALLQRERTGQGQHVDVSMLESAMVLMSSTVAELLITGTEPQRRGNHIAGGNPFIGSFETRDGLLFVGAMEQHQQRNFCRVVGCEPLLDKTGPTASQPRGSAVDRIATQLPPLLRARSAEEWERMLNEAGVPAMRVRTLKEALDEPQLNGRNLIGELPLQTRRGPARVPMLPFRMSDAAPIINSAPPTLGQHTAEILSALGYSGSELEDLQRRGVI